MRYFLRSLRVFISLVLFLVLCLLLFLGWADMKRPSFPPEQVLFAGEALPVAPDTLSLYSWNIGYAGLGEGMDFFFDGGRMVRPDSAVFNASLTGLTDYLEDIRNADMVLLQEVDTLARRSFQTNLKELVSMALPDYHAFFALNYLSAFVPVPLSEPMGPVRSGLLTLSAYQPSQAIRYALPGRYAWPKRLFMPERCLLLLRFPLISGKELVVMNIHNSAFDAGGSQRREQLEFIRRIAGAEHAKGHYVIVGGDWNQNPPGYEPGEVENGDTAVIIPPPIQDTLLPGWTWAYAPGTPTNRFLDMPYARGSTLTTIIDFFLLSPGIQLLDVTTADLAFRHSDHHPVKVRVKLD